MAEPILTEVVGSSVALSDPMVLDLDIYRGDTGRFRITITNEDEGGPPIDLTGAEWHADIRTKASLPTIVSSFTIVPVVGDISSIDVILDKENADKLTSGKLVYDIEMHLNDEVVTLVTGKVIVTQDVSRP